MGSASPQNPGDGGTAVFCVCDQPGIEGFHRTLQRGAGSTGKEGGVNSLPALKIETMMIMIIIIINAK